tara:strand:- start:797 stop:1711 length:915 start_codon:yes stop_codon:yes gene_type:complete
MVRPMGRTEPQAFVNSQGTPSVTFQTRDIKTVLDAVPLMSGKQCIDDAGAAAGAVFRYQKRSDYGTFDTGAVHWSLTSAQGYLFIESIEADSSSADGVVANLTYIPLTKTGVDDPFVITDDVNLSATELNPDFVSLYYPGPIYTGNGGTGTTYLGPTNRISINPGLNFAPELEDGYTWPRVGVLRTRDPAFDVSFVKGNVVSDLFSGGTGSLTGNPHGGSYSESTEAVTVFLRKGSKTTAAGREAIGDEKHIAIEVDSTYIQVPSWNVSGEDDVNTTISVRGAGNASSSIFSWYTDVEFPEIPA